MFAFNKITIPRLTAKKSPSYRAREAEMRASNDIYTTTTTTDYAATPLTTGTLIKTRTKAPPPRRKSDGNGGGYSEPLTPPPAYDPYRVHFDFFTHPVAISKALTDAAASATTRPPHEIAASLDALGILDLPPNHLDALARMGPRRFELELEILAARSRRQERALGAPVLAPAPSANPAPMPTPALAPTPNPTLTPTRANTGLAAKAGAKAGAEAKAEKRKMPEWGTALESGSRERESAKPRSRIFRVGLAICAVGLTVALALAVAAAVLWE
ncbi:uncharacterized protein K452DRAFT_333654 [Aplosporella prunicola CBS 121167]|uniref:Uncharacterized protein n=1 Tax=Aplosporella prunicola CBS 121167 TaxID=1176127 RepID=A0A6A6BEX5_9PEZI|nr:uncharacterized protein K452DRAFT_333654 [Aplosporella prunicola CBS 121167]KAF2141865.1 hypothetical protein K452DRAFT_333654 [Aplosporella prunicola CBS 121167]